jgi:hypothetical protein
MKVNRKKKCIWNFEIFGEIWSLGEMGQIFI